MADRPTNYADYWDRYAAKTSAKLSEKATSPLTVWPGDEWGSPEGWRATFKRMFADHLQSDVRTAIEIGPGAGKYTLMFLEAFPASTVIAADISSAYLNVLKERCAEKIAQGRIHPVVIRQVHSALSDIAEARGIRSGELDVLFSIDAMVHVDLQFLMAYWLSGQRLLRPGGKMIMTVADATRDSGFKKLVDGVPIYFPRQGEQTDKFEWLCPQLVENLLGRLGFSVADAIPEAVRDYHFVATKL